MIDVTKTYSIFCQSKFILSLTMLGKQTTCNQFIFWNAQIVSSTQSVLTLIHTRSSNFPNITYPLDDLATDLQNVLQFQPLTTTKRTAYPYRSIWKHYWIYSLPCDRRPRQCGYKATRFLKKTRQIQHSPRRLKINWCIVKYLRFQLQHLKGSFCSIELLSKHFISSLIQWEYRLPRN